MARPAHLSPGSVERVSQARDLITATDSDLGFVVRRGRFADLSSQLPNPTYHRSGRKQHDYEHRRRCHEGHPPQLVLGPARRTGEKHVCARFFARV